MGAFGVSFFELMYLWVLFWSGSCKNGTFNGWERRSLCAIVGEEWYT